MIVRAVSDLPPDSASTLATCHQESERPAAYGRPAVRTVVASTAILRDLQARIARP